MYCQGSGHIVTCNGVADSILPKKVVFCYLSTRNLNENSQYSQHFHYHQSTDECFLGMTSSLAKVNKSSGAHLLDAFSVIIFRYV